MVFTNWPYSKFRANFSYFIWTYFPGLTRRPLYTIASTPNSRRRSELWLFLSRWFIPIGVLCRYLLHPDVHKERIFSLTPACSFWSLWFILLAYFIVSHIHHHKIAHCLTDSIERRRFGGIYSAIDTIWIGIFFLLARTPQSDIPLLLFIPLVTACEYRPVRGNLWGAAWFLGVFGVSAVLVQALEPGLLSPRELILVVAPKVIIFPLVTFYLLWTLLHLGSVESMFEAVFDKAGDGLTMIEAVRADDKCVRPGKILRMNDAQRKFAPSAKELRKVCWEEFESPSEDTCLWCPVSPVLNGEKHTDRSITRSWVSQGDNRKDLGYFDVSASLMNDETGAPVLAVEVVKEITSEVGIALMAKEFTARTDREAILDNTAMGIRAMFRAKQVAVYELVDSSVLRSRVVSRRGERKVLRGLIGPEHGDVVLTQGILKELQLLPLEIAGFEFSAIDFSKSALQANQETAKWQESCVPSPNIELAVLAKDLSIEKGLLCCIGSGDSLWGLICVEFDSDDVRVDGAWPTRFDVMQCQLAAELVRLALSAAKKQEAGQQQANSERKIAERRSPAIQDLVTQMAKAEAKEEVIALCLHGVTSGKGLAFTRAMYFEKTPDGLRAKMGIGPLISKDAEMYNRITAEPFKEFFQKRDWFRQLTTNPLNKQIEDLRALPPVNLGDLEGSVIQNACSEPAALLGSADDPFAHTATMKALMLHEDFAVSSVHFRGKIHGAIVADRRYSPDDDNKDMDGDDLPALMFLASVTGACLEAGGSIDTRSLIDALLVLATARYESAERDARQLEALCVTTADLLDLDREARDLVSLASLAANLASMTWNDRVLVEHAEANPDEKKVIQEHGRLMAEFLERVKSEEELGRVIRAHHSPSPLPSDHRTMEDLCAYIIHACEFFLALVGPRAFYGRTPVEPAIAKDELISGGIESSVAEAVCRGYEFLRQNQ